MQTPHAPIENAMRIAVEKISDKLFTIVLNPERPRRGHLFSLTSTSSVALTYERHAHQASQQRAYTGGFLSN